MTTETKFKNSKDYKKAFAAFSKQFDVAELLAIHINDEGKVYAGEWLDSNGVFNFNSGFAPDVAKTIKFV